MNCHSRFTRCVASAVAASLLAVTSLPTLACTALVFSAQDGAGIYARTMEWGASDLKSEMVLVPRGWGFRAALGDGKIGMTWKSRLGFVGINGAALPYATDGMNEAGLTVGALFFPGFAEYQTLSTDRQSVAISSVEVVNYLLSNFKTVAEVRAAMPGIQVVRNMGIEKEFGGPIPLHHIVADATGASIVIEYTKGTLHIYDNKVGAMTNSPSYDWHELNLRNYPHLQALGAAPTRNINGVSLAPFGAGSGMLGLPGDFTPPSRFIRAVAFVQTMAPAKNAAEGVSAAATMLNNFDIPKGLVREGPSADDATLGYTQWSAVGDMRNKVYYYWTMYDRRMRRVDLAKLNFDAARPASFPLDRQRVEDTEDRTADFTR
jgi:choloylglycine hydrolase